jgi:LysR family hydrogen peroxide-inducible transcriptional activator
VLGVCPELARFAQASEGIQRTFEGSSLETIRHMVASGIGLTVLPSSAVPKPVPKHSLLAYIPLQDDSTQRTIALVWRKSFARLGAIRKLQQCIVSCPLNGVHVVGS